jgi:hypothetical protein
MLGNNILSTTSYCWGSNPSYTDRQLDKKAHFLRKITMKKKEGYQRRIMLMLSHLKECLEAKIKNAKNLFSLF